MTVLARYEYHRARSMAEAWRLAAELPDARFIAGGTDLLVQIRKGRLAAAGALISLRSIPELAWVVKDTGLSIGGMATMSDILGDPVIRALYPALCAAARIVGSPQIQNVATLGGNLCNASPAADTAVPLLVLDARLRLENSGGSREIGIEEFFVGPGRTMLAKG